MSSGEWMGKSWLESRVQKKKKNHEVGKIDLVRLGHGRGREWGLDSDEECGLHGLGTDGKPSNL